MDNFTNVKIDLDKLPKIETIQLIPISKAYLKITLFNLAVFTVIALLASILSFIYLEEGETLHKIIFLLIKIIVIAVIDVLMIVSFYRKSYAFREHDLIYRSGIISEMNEIIPYNRIQHVTIKQSWLARILTIGNIQVFTAAGNRGSIEIPGIPIDKANQLKDFLLHKINHQAQQVIKPEEKSTEIDPIIEAESHD